MTLKIEAAKRISASPAQSDKLVSLVRTLARNTGAKFSLWGGDETFAQVLIPKAAGEIKLPIEFFKFAEARIPKGFSFSIEWDAKGVLLTVREG